MLVLSSQSRLFGTNPIVWLCNQEPVNTFQKGPPPEKGKLKRWWTYLSQFRLTVDHIQGIKNEMAGYISRNNLDALLGQSSRRWPKRRSTCGFTNTAAATGTYTTTAVKYDPREIGLQCFAPMR